MGGAKRYPSLANRQKRWVSQGLNPSYELGSIQAYALRGPSSPFERQYSKQSVQRLNNARCRNYGDPAPNSLAIAALPSISPLINTLPLNCLCGRALPS
jgi:hypothetical protein